jgi:hypothetical protein
VKMLWMVKWRRNRWFGGGLWLALFWNFLVFLFQFIYYPCIVLTLTKKGRSLNSNFNLIYLVFFLLLWVWKEKNSDVKKDVGFDLGKWWQEEKTRCINYKGIWDIKKIIIINLKHFIFFWLICRFPTQ